MTPAIGLALMFFGTLFFMLLGRSQLRHVLVMFFEEREARLRMLKILNDIEHNLTGYLERRDADQCLLSGLAPG